MKLSKKIFWDVNFESLDFENHQLFIFERVIMRGNIDDWNFLKKKYGLNRLSELSTQLVNIDWKSLCFLSNLFDIPQQEFKCYSKIQSKKPL